MQFPKYSKNRLSQLSDSDRKAIKQRLNPRTGSATGLFVVALICVVVTSLIYFFAGGLASSPEDHSAARTLETTNRPADRKIFPVTIRKPDGPPRVFTGTNDIHGQPVTVACSTCHATREPNSANKVAADLNEFHSSLEIAHGTTSCLSCHNSTDYDALKLADGTRVEFTDVMTLCAQCHGQQMKDYQHGVHGGFNGHWDLTRGPQEKNNCVDCHNPHSPQFPHMQPTFKPRDRFLNKNTEHDESSVPH